MPPGQHPCPACGQIIGNRAKRCRYCGDGELRESQGYLYLYKPGHPLAHRDGYVAEHRYVLHAAGIELPRGCHVHHRNGRRDDNRIENLEVKAARDHISDHVRDSGDLIVNQYGVFPVLRDEQARRERLRELNQRRREYKVAWAQRKRLKDGATPRPPASTKRDR